MNMEKFVRKALRPFRGDARKRFDQAQLAMRLGYMESGLRELHELVEGHRRLSIRREAARTLLAWQLSTGASPLSLRLAMSVLTGSGSRRKSLTTSERILLAEACRREGNNETAARFLDTSSGWDQEFAFGLANLRREPAERIVGLNEVLEKQGLEQVHLCESGRTVFDRLGSTPAEGSGSGTRAGEPLVSVIMPIYNAADTIATALRSLLTQTHQNLEILVADDASSDATCDVVEKVARHDARVRLIRSSENHGCYSARNRGLQAASGVFVTCHDADDWSHPRKIERQVDDLVRNPNHIANFGQWVRASEELDFELAPLLGSFLQINPSSLMFRREPVVSKAGYWDAVRYAGDSEFIQRLRALYGRERVTHLQGLLSIGRSALGSLTRASASRHFELLYGSRLYYRWRFDAAHKSGQTHVSYPLPERNYEIPLSMRPVRMKPASGCDDLDIALVADFRQPPESLAGEIEESRRRGWRIGLVHIPYPRGKLNRPLEARVLALIDQGHVRYIPFGEEARVDFVVIRDASIIREFNDYVPKLKVRHVLACAETVGAVSNLAVCQMQAIIERYFGQSPSWIRSGERIPEPAKMLNAPAEFVETGTWLEVVQASRANDPACSVPNNPLANSPLIA